MNRNKHRSILDSLFGLNKLFKIPDSLELTNIENNIEKEELEKLDLNKIISVNFPHDRYYRNITKKNKIVLHHTVSGRGVKGDINWWKTDRRRIATALIIDWKGDKYQLFSSKYWAHHLGVSNSIFYDYGINNMTNKKLNQSSIGIEIDAWGGLVRSNRNWYPAKWDKDLSKYIANKSLKPIDSNNVAIFPDGYRGFYGFEKYTDEQIESVRKLLIYWNEVYKIPLDYNDDMWDVSKNALNGKSGIWSHTSFRPDKSDCYPDERLIEMLKSLNK